MDGSPCDDMAKLVEAYTIASNHYTVAVNDLTMLRGSTTHEAYTRLKIAAESARESAISAREAIERHRQEHGC